MIMTNFARINLATKNPRDIHLYTIDARKGMFSGTVDVEARNRDQAARIAMRHGFEVLSVNMVG